MDDKVYLKDLEKGFKLKLLTPDITYDDIEIVSRDINRPGIQLAGYLKYYDPKRIQIVGYVEWMFLNELDEKQKLDIYTNLLVLGAPCFIFCRDLIPDELFLSIAVKEGVPVFSTKEVTTVFMSDIIKWLSLELAPVITLHGCLVDIYGTGVFIRGESGIGKSEATLELIKRGHRFIADDAVEIHKVSETTLYGRAPHQIRDFLEIRGIGMVDIKTLYGIQSIMETQTIDLVVTLEEWDRTKNYSRLETQIQTVDILGNVVSNYVIPVRPGRNIAVILEAVAVIYRQKQMGYDSDKTLQERLKETFGDQIEVGP